MKNLDLDRCFYVYVHRRNTDNAIFYVGKGKGSRLKSRSGRTKWWKNIVKKHGHTAEIIYDGLTNSEACNLEIETIKNLLNKGVVLCNVSKGGESGLAGIPLTKEHKEKLRQSHLGRKQSLVHARKSAMAKVGKKQPRAAVEAMVKDKRKRVINSNGEVFLSASHAARAMAERHGVYASQGNISMACRGERPGAYGYGWSYDTENIPPAPTGENLVKKTVYCSNGMKFKSVADAVSWIISWRGSAAHQCVSACARGESKTAYGFSWEYF